MDHPDDLRPCRSCGFNATQAGHWGGLEEVVPGEIPYCTIRNLVLPSPLHTTCANQGTGDPTPRGPVFAQGLYWAHSRVPWYWDCEPVVRTWDGPCPDCHRVGAFHLLLPLPGEKRLWFCTDEAYRAWWEERERIFGRSHLEILRSSHQAR